MADNLRAPSLDGSPLGPCLLYDQVLRKIPAPVPKATEDGLWARRAFFNDLLEIDNDGEQSQRIWDSVLTIWRLKSVDEDGLEDESWRSHIRAWVVRSAIPFTFYL